MPKESAFKLRSGNSPLFKTMGSSPMNQLINKGETGEKSSENIDKKSKKTNILRSFRDFLSPKTKQTPEGRKTGDIKRKMFSSNIEVRMKAQKENRARLKKAKVKSVEKKTKPEHAEMYTFTTSKPKKFKSEAFKGRKGDPYSYRTTKGGYEFSKGGKKWKTATDSKAIEAIGKRYKEYAKSIEETSKWHPPLKK